MFGLEKLTKLRKPKEEKRAKLTSDPDSIICPNCKIQMEPKIIGLEQYRTRSKIKEYFVCKECGFEKRLA